MTGRPRPTILVVDDDGHNRDLLAQELDLLGCASVAAADGRAALEHLARRAVDLVLLDVMMPGIDGIEVLRRLKADPVLRHIPVVMISAVDDVASIVACITLGAEDYLPKPFDPVLLKARVTAGLERAGWRAQERAYLAEIETQMRAAEAARREADALLEVILPAPALSELRATGRIAPRRYEEVAVLFADIVDFTGYAKAHPPEEVVANLDVLMEASERLIAAHGLEKIKTIGDGFVATGNLLRPHDTPVLACAAFGLALVGEAVQTPARWRIRVGIDVGAVVAGVVGRDKFSFDLWGDSVNVAARLSGYGTEAAVFLTRTAWTTAARTLVGSSRGSLDLKGRGLVEVMECHALVQRGVEREEGGLKSA